VGTEKFTLGVFSCSLSLARVRSRAKFAALTIQNGANMSPLLAQNPTNRTPAYRRPSRLGWTLVEVLLVVAIAGILSALLFPAVSSSRESARLTSCNNNLHQIGLALTQFHNQHREFPIGCVEWRPPANTTRRQLAWSAFLLPFLGEQKIYYQLKFNTPINSLENAPAASTILPVYICPTSNRGIHKVQGRGPCDYGGIYGERINGASPKPQGMMLLTGQFELLTCVMAYPIH